MTPAQENVAESCLRGAENDTMTFPRSSRPLFKRALKATLSITVDAAQSTIFPMAKASNTPHTSRPGCERFDAGAIQAAIRDAQQLVPDYTYKGFCQKVTKAGCAGYVVSFAGRRAVYMGRTADIHVEHFPS